MLIRHGRLSIFLIFIVLSVPLRTEDVTDTVDQTDPDHEIKTFSETSETSDNQWHQSGDVEDNPSSKEEELNLETLQTQNSEVLQDAPVFYVDEEEEGEEVGDGEGEGPGMTDDELIAEHMEDSEDEYLEEYIPPSPIPTEHIANIKQTNTPNVNQFEEMDEVPPPKLEDKDQVGQTDLFEAQKILGLRSNGKESSSEIIVSKPNYRKAYSLLEKSVGLGNNEAKVLLGYAHLTGEHVPYVSHNTTRAFELFSDASNSGLPSAQYALGMMYASGITTESSQSKALLYYTFAALGGDTKAQMALGFRYWSGISVAQSCESALKYYTLVADSVARKVGSVGTGQVVLRIRLMEEEQSPQDSPLLDEDLVQYYQFLADKGDLQAQLGLGQLYLSGGRGIDRNVKLAQHYFSLAAKSGNTNAYGYLGKIAMNAKEYDVSHKYFKLAAKDPLGQWGIGMLYYNGWGLQQDYKQALAYFTSAAAQGYTEAELQLGVMFLSGIGVTKDYGVALKHFNLASKAGHVLAFYNLGMMHAEGVGVMRNCQTAAELLKNVAERGSWGNELMDAHALYHKGFIDFALIKYIVMAEQGYEVAQTNAAYILDKDETEFISSLKYRYNRAFVNWRRAATQGFGGARLKLGDYYYYGKGTEVNSEEAAEQYQLASDLDKNPQAMFNLGYMHEVGIGRQQDNHLAKRFYDLAATTSADAHIPATLANTRLRTKIFIEWLIRSYQHFNWSTLVEGIYSIFTGTVGKFTAIIDFFTKLFTELEDAGGQEWDIYMMSILAVLLGIVMAVRGNNARVAQQAAQLANQQPQPNQPPQPNQHPQPNQPPQPNQQPQPN